MTSTEASASPSVRAKVSTGYNMLDEALQGGFLAGAAIVLSAPASDEVPLLIGNFLRAPKEQGLLVCRTLSSAEMITQNMGENVRSLICSDKPVSPSRTILPGKGIENLTELNLQIGEVIASTQPKRLVIDILSDILLRHKALQTRKWLTELLERLRSKEITTLAVINPLMHSAEDVQAVIDLFDGNLEIFEDELEGTLRKHLRIKWMHGIEVSEKEVQLHDLAPETSPQPATAPVPASSREPRWLTPLVSRTEELSRLKSAFDDALAKKSTVVAIHGEPGVGKTRLMQELAVYAGTKKTVVLSGSASEHGIAYGPWIEVARQYVSQAPGELLRRMLVGAQISEFARLVPDIAVKLGTIPPSKSLGDQQLDKMRLFEAVTQFFRSISSEAPLLVLLDDMQLADQASLDLLDYFVRGTGNLPILTICSLPAERDIDATSPLEQTFMKLNKQRLLEKIPLRNLSRIETTELIKQIFGEQTLSADFADLIYKVTDGNPFFVEEVLRSLVDDGTIFRTEKGWDRKPIQELVVPKSVKATLRSRLKFLDQESLNILTWAAVIGGEFDYEVLKEATELPEETLLEKLESVHNAGLVVEAPGSKTVFRFADNRIRELLLDDIIRIRRTRYHLKIAEAMEKVFAGKLDRHAESMAHHFSEAGDTKRAIHYSIMAGDFSQSIHAYDHAADNYKRAVALMDMESGDGQEKAIVLEKLAGAYYYSNRATESTKCYSQSLEIFEKLHDGKSCARLCASLAKATYEIKFDLSKASEVPQILKRGLGYIENESESFEAASIYATLGDYYELLDQYDEANPFIEKAIQIGEKTGNFGAFATALLGQGYSLADSGNVDDGLPLMERALDVALKHEQNSVTVFCLMNLSAYTYPRNLAKSREYSLRLLEFSKRMGAVFGEVRGLGCLWFADWMLGNWEAAGKEFSDGLALKERIGTTTTRLVEGMRVWFSLSTGDLDAAERYLHAALASEDSKITHIVINNLPAALLRLEQGKEDEARAHLETCVNAFKNSEFTTDPLLHVETLLHLTSLYARSGEFEKAANMSQWARRLAEKLHSDAGLAMAAQAEASLFLAQGNQIGAEGAYVKSLDLWEKAGWPYYKAKALVAYSHAIAQSNPQEFRKMLLEAVEIFRKLGARHDLEKAEAKLSAKA